MKFITSSGGLPVGHYAAEFVSIEDFKSDPSNDYGPAVVLTFKVIAGELENETATRIVSAKLSRKSILHEFVRCFRNGVKPEAGEEIDMASFYGITGTIFVEEFESGNGTRVERFMKGA